MPRPGRWASAAAITAGSVESIMSGAVDAHREQLDDARHLLGFVGALGERDAHVEHVRAGLRLLARDAHDAVVVVGQQQPLHGARALRS